MTVDERIECIEAIPDVDPTGTRVMRCFRESGGLGWQLTFVRYGVMYFFGNTIHEALLAAEREFA